MTKEIETDRPSQQQEGLNAIAQLLQLAASGINPTSLIEEVCQQSKLSPPNGKFTEAMVKTAQDLTQSAPKK